MGKILAMLAVGVMAAPNGVGRVAYRPRATVRPIGWHQDPIPLRRPAKRDYPRIGIIVTILALVFALGLSYSKTLPTARQALVPPTPEMLRDAATAEFFRTQVGSIRMDRVGDDKCWLVDFNNRTGGFRNYRRIECAGHASIKPAIESAASTSGGNDRFIAVRDAFVNR